MRGNWDWNIIPEDKAEWVIFCVALLIVLGAALWIFRLSRTSLGLSNGSCLNEFASKRSTSSKSHAPWSNAGSRFSSYFFRLSGLKVSRRTTSFLYSSRVMGDVA
jgi:hypothetical protein